MVNYKATLARKIRDLLKESLGGAFKSYFIGDPYAIPQSMLPAICVVKRRSSYPTEVPTGTDERSNSLIVRIVANLKDEFGKNADEASLQDTIENLVEGIDETTNQYSTNSIMGILRQKYTLDGLVISNEAEIDYYINTNRPGELTTLEVDITLALDERFVLSNRN